MTRLIEKNPKISLGNSQFLGLLTLLFMSGLGLTFLFNLILLILLTKMANKPPVNLVQTVDGYSFSQYRAIGNKQRSPESIQRYVTEIIGLTFSWTGIIPDEFSGQGRPIQDPGVKISLKQDNQTSKFLTLPTTTWAASFGYNLQFRNQFLITLEQYIPASVFTLKTQVVFLPIHIGKPVSTGEGKWKMNLIGNILYKSANGEETTVPFNKQIYVQAVDSQTPLGLEDISSQYLLGVINKIRQAGLEIYQIEDVEVGKNDESDSRKNQ